MLCEVSWRAEGKDRRALGGAVASPEKIALSAQRPADFDAFWKDKLKELAAVPPNPELLSAPSGKAVVAYWKITMDNIRGTHIRGQLARPEKGEKLPALLIVQWAGVYPLQKNWVDGSRRRRLARAEHSGARPAHRRAGSVLQGAVRGTAEGLLVHRQRRSRTPVISCACISPVIGRPNT